MDTQGPTSSGYVRHVLEEGSLAPPATPTPSESRRQETHFLAQSSSPLRASSRTSTHSSRRATRSSAEIVECTTAGEEAAVPVPPDRASTSKPKSTRHIFRRPVGASKKRTSRHSESTEKSSKPTPQSWVGRLRKSRYSPRMVLENSGSVARDHLASERTFLAYVRTSMALASMGVGTYHSITPP